MLFLLEIFAAGLAALLEKAGGWWVWSEGGVWDSLHRGFLGQKPAFVKKGQGSAFEMGEGR